MPRWASRIVRPSTAVRLERLQEITEADAIAEGVERWIIGEGWREYGLDPRDEQAGTPPLLSARESFRSLWNWLNAKPRAVKERIPHGWLTTHYEAYPWSEADFAARYPKAHKTHMWRGKPVLICANPWLWVVEFARMERG
jgi:hypothetical protein